MMAFVETKDKKYLEIFMKVFDYSKKHFIDEINGEWHGYLNRDGTPCMRIKGGPYKGSFHVPRCLMMLEEMLKNQL
jgi:N-acylglucosamine 2-epimerase